MENEIIMSGVGKAPQAPLKEGFFAGLNFYMQPKNFLAIGRGRRDILTTKELVAPICDPSNWMLMAGCEDASGIKEISGSENSERIIEYHDSTKLRANDDETPWCSSFVNWTMEQAGYPGTNSAAALSWKNWGQEAEEPVYGAIAVIDYGKGKGHVGFVAGVSKDGKTVYLLGGNQSDQVKISAFSVDKIASYRMPDAINPDTYSPPPIVENQRVQNHTTLNQTR
ncbi:MAG: TIGR02594 family protein [Verrucomicrobiae bacterium]|nr:TIGR02594 family protein [Verrucomicrobiae bacterium]